LGNGDPAPEAEEKVFGFLKLKLVEGKLYAKYYFKSKLGDDSWKTWDAPVLQMEKLHQEKEKEEAEEQIKKKEEEAKKKEND